MHGKQLFNVCWARGKHLISLGGHVLFEHFYSFYQGWRKRESGPTGVSDDEQFEQMIVVLSRHFVRGLESFTVHSEGGLRWPIRQNDRDSFSLALHCSTRPVQNSTRCLHPQSWYFPQQKTMDNFPFSIVIIFLTPTTTMSKPAWLVHRFTLVLLSQCGKGTGQKHCG